MILKNTEGIYDFTIKSYESDFLGNMTLPAFFLYLQECAWENAKQNDFGYEFVEEQGALWVLTKVKLKMKQYPKWKEAIKVRTWPRSPEGLFALRDYQLIKDEKIIGLVTSYWLILDKLSKRPRRIMDFDFAHQDFLCETALGESLGKIKIGIDPKEVDQRKVYPSDLDVNGHVNNASYVKWIIDAHSSIQNKEIKSFEINFLNELYINDSFLISCFVGENGYQYVIKNLLTGKPICYAELT